MHARTLAAALLAGAALAAHAAGTVDVSFTDPAKFTDAGNSRADIPRTTRSLEDYLRKLGDRLPDGQVLKVTITDIDLAGWVRYGRQGEVRVIRGGADWPRIDLRWELLEGGRAVKQGTETLADLNYTGTPLGLPRDNDLPYEKRMLAAWFHAHFDPAQP